MQHSHQRHFTVPSALCLIDVGLAKTVQAKSLCPYVAGHLLFTPVKLVYTGRQRHMKCHYDLDGTKLGWAHLLGMGAQALALLCAFDMSRVGTSPSSRGPVEDRYHLRGGSAVHLLPHPALHHVWCQAVGKSSLQLLLFHLKYQGRPIPHSLPSPLCFPPQKPFHSHLATLGRRKNTGIVQAAAVPSLSTFSSI